MSGDNATLRWVPLESNPELFTEWSSSLGLDTSKYAFHDVYGLDAELLSMVPQPVQAVLLLFPISDAYEEKRRREDEQEQDQSKQGGGEREGELWFKQTIGNACGTIGLLHAISNTQAIHAVSADSPLDKLIRAARPLSPDDRASLLQSSRALATAHSTAASSGQSQAPTIDQPVDLHFVAFVRDANACLAELDGRRRGIVRRNEVTVETQEDLLQRAVEWIRDNYMTLSPDSLNFNLIALGPAA